MSRFMHTLLTGTGKPIRTNIGPDGPNPWTLADSHTRGWMSGCRVHARSMPNSDDDEIFVFATGGETAGREDRILAKITNTTDGKVMVTHYGKNGSILEEFTF
jgi:hypothetical protein